MGFIRRSIEITARYIDLRINLLKTYLAIAFARIATMDAAGELAS